MTQTSVSPTDYRRALANYPTGVAVVTARGVNDSPVAMVIGTFTSVSLDPPLVGFLADRNSESWAGIRASGHFCVSVLGAVHEHVCRSFATKSPDRFRHASVLAGTGSPRLEDAALWVDCDLEAVVPAGDHDFVLGRVRELGVGEEGGLPLLFLRGGYGAPRIASLQAQAPGLGPVLRLADQVRPEIEAVARDLGLECAVSAAVDGEVVFLAAAGVGSTAAGQGTHVGSAFPLAAPMAPLFVAWAGAAEQRRWLAEGTRLSGLDMQERGNSELEAVRARGYMVATGRPVSDRFQRVVLSGKGATSQGQDEFGAIIRARADRGQDPGLTAPIVELTDVASMHAAVRHPDGHVLLCLDLIGFTGDELPAELERSLKRLLSAAARATELLAEEFQD